MELEEEQVEAQRRAGYLHDIGKIAVDSAILCKPRKLDADETRIVTRHPQVSYDILANIRFPYRDVALLARHHHERVNGSGYPDGRRGDDLTPGMKILSLADAFDAMTSDRPYRPALPLEKVLTEIASWVDVQFDRQVTNAFLTALKREASDESGLPADGVLAGLGRGCRADTLPPVIDRLLATIH
jgi:HD-GYP domain-containing protein (c-di-GMP phosphodiesterase class II)